MYMSHSCNFLDRSKLLLLLQKLIGKARVWALADVAVNDLFGIVQFSCFPLLWN